MLGDFDDKNIPKLNAIQLDDNISNKLKAISPDLSRRYDQLHEEALQIARADIPVCLKKGEGTVELLNRIITMAREGVSYYNPKPEKEEAAT